jgi:hypothetical protein
MRSLALAVLGLLATANSFACTSAVHRQFDFWIGSWTVRTGDKVAGHNQIERVANGCALREDWRGRGGLTGTSLTFFDERRGVWHQTWIGSDGEALYLEGKFAAGTLTLEGSRPAADGKSTLEQITWTPLPNGHVRQRWERRSDDKWAVVFDGTYERGNKDDSPSNRP